MRSFRICLFASLILLFSASSSLLQAQNCTSCTLTITAPWTSPLAAGAGVTICISSTGSVSGDILINGGTICNEGMISSHNILMTSGTLNNYGEMDVVNFAASSGNFTNNGLASVDSLSQNGAFTHFINADSLSGLAHSMTDHSQFENAGHYGVVNTSVSYGSQFTNTAKISNDHFSVFNITDSTSDALFLNDAIFHNDSLFVCNSIINNYGSMVVDFDFHMALDAHMNNYEYFNVGRDFWNDSVSELYTSCMIEVGRNWTNQGIMNGPDTLCGGFAVAGLTANTGYFGFTGNLDMCDATNPGSFDLNTGTLGSNVSFCNCDHECTYTASVPEVAPMITSFQLFPNPAVNQLNMVFNSQEDRNAQWYISDLYGRRIMSANCRIYKGSNVIHADLQQFSPGMYFISLIGEGIQNQTTFVKQ
jgi:hypothetical protein